MSSPQPEDRPVRIRIARISGEVIVRGEARDDVQVAEGEGAPELDDDGVFNIRPRGRSGRVVVLVPTRSELVVGTITGAVTIEGQVAAARVNTKSGAIRVDQSGDVDARTLSGAITVGSCDRCRAKTASGHVRIGPAAKVEAMSISGRIEIEEIRIMARVRSVSGRVDVAAGWQSTVVAETVSGQLTVTVAPGVQPDFHIRTAVGRINTDIERGNDARIRVRSLSGSVRVLHQ